MRVLFVCTENAGRSQIAEALLAHKGRARFEVASAGSGPALRVHPLAIEALRLQGIDWSGRTPKGFAAVLGAQWDLVILKVPIDQLERAALERRLGGSGTADTAMVQP